MASYVRAQVIWNRLTGLPEDAQTNTFHMKSNALTPVGTANAFDTPLNTWLGAVAVNMATSLFTTTVNVKYFDMTDPEPRVPIQQTSHTVTLTAATPLPEECSMCLSMQAVAMSGVPQARRRGRIFLPTFNQPTTAVVSGRVEWVAATRTGMATAFHNLADAANTADCDLQVYSPTIFSLTNDLDQAMAPVDNGWIDNSPDTQRRRGHPSTGRTLWVV